MNISFFVRARDVACFKVAKRIGMKYEFCTIDEETTDGIFHAGLSFFRVTRVVVGDYRHPFLFADLYLWSATQVASLADLGL